MKRSIKIFLILLVAFLLNITSTKAYTVSNLNRNDCNKFEVVLVKSDSITHVACYDWYDDAFRKMNETDIKDGIPSIVFNNQFVNSKYALVNLRTKPSANYNSYVYPTETSYSDSGYINGYYASDAALASIYYTGNDSTTRAYITISGLKGHIAKSENGLQAYEIVPLTLVKSPNKYVVSNGSLIHYIANQIGNDGSYSSSFSIGPAPSSLKSNTTYYSYDGNYFYTSLYDLIDDFKASSHDRAVNKDNAYYNYYQYLPQRTRTNITSVELDSFLRSKGKTISNSKLYGQGHYFITSQDTYGINALISYSISLNESAYGSSSIAMNKNNVFGHAAYDYDPSGSSTAYSSVMYSINYHADVYMSRGYSYTGDWRYYGSYLGNKLSGVNVKYASDPYWGEKAASYYYNIDRTFNLKDYDYYTIGIKNVNDNVNVRSAPTTSSSVIYTIPSNKYPTYIIVGEVEGDNYRDSKVWYKILFDSSLDGSSPSKSVNYDFGKYVYIHSSVLTKLNNPSSYKNPKDVVTVDTGVSYNKENSDKYYDVTSNTTMYYDPFSKSNTNISISKGTKVLVKETAFNSKGNIAYLVQYGSNTEWISNASITYDDTYNKLLASIKYKDLEKPVLLKVKSDLKIYTDGVLVSATSNVIKKNSYVVATKVAYNDSEKYSYLITYNATNGASGYIDASKVSGVADYKIGNNNDNFLLNIRSEANTWSSIVGTTSISYTNFVVLDEVVGQDISGNTKWYKIIYNSLDNNVGYVSSNFVSIVVDSKKTEEQPATQTDTPTKTEEQTVTQTDTSTKTEEQPATQTDTPAKTEEVINYKNASGLFEFSSLSFDSKNNKFNFAATLKVDGVSLSKKYNVEYALILKDLNDKSKQYTVSLDSHDYSNININSSFDLSDIPQGDYSLYVRARVNGYEAECLLNNVFGRKTIRKITSNKRGYLFRTNYYSNYVPIELSIRDSGNISTKDNPTTDNMFNDYVNIGLKDNKLNIRGTSFNVGGDYSTSQNVTRKIILENTSTFKRTTYNVSYIDNGDYEVVLRVSDNKSKTRAWFDASLDLSKLSKGTYAIYIRTTTSSVDDYGELTDIFARDLSKMTLKLSNGLTAKLRLNKDIRMRVELVIE